MEHYKHFAHGNLVDRHHFTSSFEVFRFSILKKMKLYRKKFHRSRYNDESNRVIFLAVSDDIQWMKVNVSVLESKLMTFCYRTTWVTILT